MKIHCFLLLTCCGIVLVQSRVSIPVKLRECYSNGTVEGIQLPMNLRVLVDLIQKAEQYSYTTTDMRTIATSIIHRFKFDGIEHREDVLSMEGILPFSGTGSQRAKNRIIEELISGSEEIFPSDALTLTERCALHHAISNTIWNHYSVDVKSCGPGPIEKISGRSLLGGTKKCPVEKGVIITPFGTIAPGTVIGAIAASLQPQNVNIGTLLVIPNVNHPKETIADLPNLNYDEEEIDLIVPKNQMILERSMWLQSLVLSPAKLDNVWVSTLAGDLAEMAVYQGPVIGSDMTLGATGFWNNTMRPSVYYLTDKHGSLDATRAEIIGGIDGWYKSDRGLIIAKNLQSWIDDFHSLRLSQVLDMYYSDKGVPFNTNVKACQRARTFWHIAPKTVLEEQTHATSRVLAYRNSFAYMTEEALKKMVNYAVDEFTAYADSYVFTEINCRNEITYPRMEVFVAFDGAWSREYTADFISVMVEDFDVSMFGSRMGLMHGTTGEWIFNVTNSPALVHYSISQLSTITWPSRLNYNRVLNNVFAYLNNTWEQKRKDHIIGNYGQAIVLLAPLTSLNENEERSAVSLLRQIKDNHPDIHFLYYVSEYNAHRFKPFVLTEEDHLIRSLRIDDITRHLLMVPMTLRPTSSPNIAYGVRDQIEDYISPLQSITYRLHPHWRKNTKKVTVTIHAVGYGAMKVCSWNQWKINGKIEGLYCKQLSGHNDVSLTDYFTCSDDKLCPNTYYRIQDVSSLMKCAEMDCKSPDQVRYIIRIENLYRSNSTIHVPMAPTTLILYVVLIVMRSNIYR